MSGQHVQCTPGRVRKTSPSCSKQGPMKATIPMASLLKQSSNLKTSNSPIPSPTSCWKTRISPDHSSGQRSPGSTAYKSKSKTLGTVANASGNLIRRTASLDTIYLRGQWPRDNFYWHSELLQIDKATQTDESDWSDARKMHIIAENSDDRLEKVILRQRLQRNNKDSSSRIVTPPGIGMEYMLSLPSASSQTNTSCLLSTSNASPVNIPIKTLPKPTMRSSIEGLNQEIERLVLKSGSSGSYYIDKGEEYDKFCQATPEGHRAPLAELFRSTRSVNTQTPAAGDLTGSSGPPSRGSLSPLMPGHLDSSPSETGGSQGSSPDQESSKLGTSPHINRFLAREPPDGCEKVNLKFLDERRGLTLDPNPQPCSTFQLKPSLGSAFQLLQPNLQTSERDLPLVPSQQDLI